jgi:hypothetical protein
VTKPSTRTSQTTTSQRPGGRSVRRAVAALAGSGVALAFALSVVLPGVAAAGQAADHPAVIAGAATMPAQRPAEAPNPCCRMVDTQKPQEAVAPAS